MSPCRYWRKKRMSSVTIAARGRTQRADSLGDLRRCQGLVGQVKADHREGQPASKTIAAASGSTKMLKPGGGRGVAMGLRASHEDDLADGCGESRFLAQGDGNVGQRADRHEGDQVHRVDVRERRGWVCEARATGTPVMLAM